MTALTPDQITAIANAGAGPVADLARQCNVDPLQDFSLQTDQIRNFGSGLMPDLLRQSYSPPPANGPPYNANIVRVSNANPAIITVSPADWPNFTVGTTVSFASTGFPELDGNSFVVSGVNGTNSTLTIPVDLTAEVLPSVNGIVSSTSFTAPSINIITNPPPRPPVLAQVIPNGYEQAAAAKGN